MGYIIHSGEKGLEAVGPAWESLEPSGAKHVFQRYTYIRQWYDHVGRRDRSTPLIVERTENGVTTAIFPACRVRRGPLTLLTWMGGPDLVDYGDILFDAPAAGVSADKFIEDALTLLRPHARGAMTYFTNVREDAYAYRGLSRQLREFKRSSAPYVEVPEAIDEYVASLSLNKRQNIRRRLRRLEERGPVEFKWIARDDPGLPKAVERLDQLIKARFNRKGHRTQLYKPGHSEFFEACALHDPTVRVGCLLSDQRCIAAVMVAVYNDRMYNIASGYEDEFERYSPGRILNYHLIRSCNEERLGVYDFCWGQESYKYDWTDLEMPLVTFVDSGIRGRLLRSAAVTRRAAVRLSDHSASMLSALLREGS